MSGVGEETEGTQDVMRMASRMNARKRREVMIL
jgi:hypothetical protein